MSRSTCELFLLLILMNHLFLRFRKKTYDLSQRTLIMGVLNVTPIPSRMADVSLMRQKALEQGMRLAEGGADILDIGGESTRPGAKPLEEEEENRRIVPVIQELSRKIAIPISVDTRKARVAEEALEAGAEMINDISALRFDGRMAEVVGQGEGPGGPDAYARPSGDHADRHPLR